MDVLERGRWIPVAKEPTDDRHGLPAPQRKARVAVTQVVKTHVTKLRLRPHDSPRPEARAVLVRQPRNGSDFVFQSLDDPLRPRSSELSLWRKVQVKAGLRDVRLHDLRHTVGSHAVMAGASIPVVSRLLGHHRPRMTLRAAHVGDRETETAAERVGSALASLIDREGASSAPVLVGESNERIETRRNPGLRGEALLG